MSHKLIKVRDIAARPLDQRLISFLNKGGREIPYLSGTTIIDMLNAAFDGSWSVTYDTPFEVKFGQTSVWHIKATITVNVTDAETGESITITREGFGEAVCRPKGEENVIKSAQTDALKKAAYTFGIAAQLRRKEAENQLYNQLAAEQTGTNWTPSIMKAYQKEWDILRTINSTYQLSMEDMVACLQRITNGRDTQISTGNIVLFTEEMQKMFPIEKAKAVESLDTTKKAS